jgi:O-antigen/teichoic acid export membrane protein
MWFPKVPPELHSAARLALVLLCLSTIVSFLAAAVQSYWVGLQEAARIARTSILFRFVGVGALIAAAVWTQDPVAMASFIVATQVLVLGVQFREVTKHAGIRGTTATAAPAAEYARAVKPLIVWSLALLLINGVDVTIIAQLDFAAVGAYGIAITVASLYASILAALAASLVPAGAAISVSNRSHSGDLLIQATKWHVLCAIALGLFLVACARPLLRLWVGPAYVEDVVPIMQVLILAQALRMSTLCYANMLIATGAHEKVMLSPVVEALTNVSSSIALGVAYGPIGVAWGTVAGAVVAIAANLLYNMPRHPEFAVPRLRYFTQGLVAPLIYSIPLFLFAGWFAR